MLGRAKHALSQRLTTLVMKRLSDKGDELPSLYLDPTIAADPYDFYQRLRDQNPMYVGASGSAILSSRELVEQTFRDARWGHPDPDRDRSLIERLMLGNPSGDLVHPIQPPSMIVINPPDHTRYRKIVSRAFTVKTVEALRPRVREIARDLIDSMRGQDQPDLMRDFAGALPVIVIAEMLGVDAAMHQKFKAWGYDVARTLDLNLSYDETVRAKSSLGHLNRYFKAEFEDRRRSPRADLMTALVEAEVDGVHLTETELMATALLLLVAGFETTVNLIGNGTKHLLDHPDQLTALQADPSLWPAAVEEILRFDSPIQMTGRTALADIELGGRSFGKGSSVTLLIGAANRDPAAYPNPNEFDIHRESPLPHVAFASGIHYCLGAALARVEGQVALEELFSACPNLSLVGDGVLRGSPLLRGYIELPVAVGEPALIS